jgi:hypothetical protein
MKRGVSRRVFDQINSGLSNKRSDPIPQEMMVVWTVSLSRLRPVARARKFKIGSSATSNARCPRRLVAQPMLSEAVHNRCVDLFARLGP